MKKIKLLLFLGLITLLNACHKPFEGLTAILSNSYIDYRVGVQVVNANPKANTYYEHLGFEHNPRAWTMKK